MIRRLGIVFGLAILLLSAWSVAAQEALDFSLEPNYGSTNLADSFTPEVFSVDLVSGGEVDASYLEGCVGFATRAPDFRLFWDGSGFVRFTFGGGGGDTTLIINDPNGNYFCNDDTFERDPAVDFGDTTPGQFDIWVGSYNAGENIEGTLYITQNPNFVPGRGVNPDDDVVVTDTPPDRGNACPGLTPVGDMEVERVDDLTAIATYTNQQTGEQYELTITGTDAEAYENYLSRAALCLTSNDPAGDDFVPPEEVVDIAFGDILFDSLEAAGVDIDSLIERRDAGEFEGRTLRDALEEQGIDPDDALAAAYETANAELNRAVESGRLSERRAEAARAEFEQMYRQALEEPDLALLGGGRNPAPVAVEIDVQPLNREQYDSTGEGGTFYIEIDPNIGQGWGAAHVYRAVGASGARVDNLCATAGRVGGYLYQATSYRWGRVDNAGGACINSGWYTGDRLYVVGWNTANAYTLSGAFRLG